MRDAIPDRVRLHRAEGSGVCVAEFEGDLDLALVDIAQPQMETMLEVGCTSFVLDLSSVDYADSSALGLMVWLNERISRSGGRIVVAGANRNVTRVLEISGLVNVVDTISTAEDVTSAVESVTLVSEPADAVWTQRFGAPANVGEIAALRRRVVDLVMPLGMTEQTAFDLQVAVGEALANAVRHGSPGGARDRVGVTVTAYPDRVCVDVTDSGEGFDGAQSGAGDVYAPCGRGVVFMRALTDSVEFLAGDGGGTRVRLVKHIPHEAAG